MRRLLPLFIGLSAVLTACPSYTPISIPMNDLNVLSGRWEGKVVQGRSVQVLFSSPQRLYLRDHDVIEVYDPMSGAKLQTLILPDTVYRNNPYIQTA